MRSSDLDRIKPLKRLQHTVLPPQIQCPDLPLCFLSIYTFRSVCQPRMNNPGISVYSTARSSHARSLKDMISYRAKIQSAEAPSLPNTLLQSSRGERVHGEGSTYMSSNEAIITRMTLRLLLRTTIETTPHHNIQVSPMYPFH